MRAKRKHGYHEFRIRMKDSDADKIVAIAHCTGFGVKRMLRRAIMLAAEEAAGHIGLDFEEIDKLTRRERAEIRWKYMLFIEGWMLSSISGFAMYRPEVN